MANSDLQHAGSPWWVRIGEWLIQPSTGIPICMLLGILPCLLVINASLLIAYDDKWGTTRNPIIINGLGYFFDQLFLPLKAQKGTGFETAHWSPLSFLSLAIDHAIFGRSPLGVTPIEADFRPWGFRLVTGLLHGLCGWLVLALGRRLTGRVGIGVAAMLVFLWHPTVCESVCWVIERNNVLPVLFGLLALMVYTGGKAGPAPSWSRTVATALLLLLSQLGKASGVSWWAMLVAWDLFLYRDGWSRRIGRSAILALPVVMSVLVVLVSHADAILPPLGKPPLGPWIMSPYLMLRHLALIVWPVNLSAFYHVSPQGPDWGSYIGWLLFWIALFCGARKLGVPWSRLGLYGVWLLAGIAPIVNPFVVTSFAIQDRYTYPSLPAFGFLLAEMVWLAASRWPRVKPAVIFSILVPILLVLTLVRSTVWESEQKLFADACSDAKQPNSAFAHGYLASNLFHSARDEQDDASRIQMLKRSLHHHERALACDDFERLIFPFWYLNEHASLRMQFFPKERTVTRGLLLRVWEGREERPNEKGAKLAALQGLLWLAGQDNDHETVLELCQQGLERSPANEKLLRNRLQALLELDRKDEAKREAQRLRTHPSVAPFAQEVLERLKRGE